MSGKTKSQKTKLKTDREGSSSSDVKKYFAGKHLQILTFTAMLIPLVMFLWILNKRIYVANVNGQMISRLEYYKELEKKDGGSVLEDLITKKIIYQEASKNNINVTQSDVDTELNNIRANVMQQGSTLEDVLTYQRLTYDKLLENIKIQKILENLLKDKISITDDEVKSRYEENKDVYGKDKTFEDVKDDISYQLYQEKITDAYRNWISEKRNASAIEKFL